MKIRIKGNSVRLRLAQDEVTKLVYDGSVFSSCDFAGGTFSYGIEASDTESISSSFQDNKIKVSVPKDLLENWDQDDRVGFQNQSGKLFILIEKDWQCLKPRDHEDESNLYKHPAARE